MVTGATSGIGLAAASALASRGDHVVLVGRHPDRLRAAVAAVGSVVGSTPHGLRADFAVLDEVRALADRLRTEYDRIDVLANNAGALIPRRMTTVDGHELTIQTNHLAGFLLTHLLLDRLPAGSRIVTTASAAEGMGRVDPDNLDLAGRRYSRWFAYGCSKQANIMFAAEAARRWPDLVPTSYHPGGVRTRFGSGSGLPGLYKFAPFLRTPERGADTLVWLAGDAAAERGGYYLDRALRQPSEHAADRDRQRRLWEASAAAVGA